MNRLEEVIKNIKHAELPSGTTEADRTAALRCVESIRDHERAAGKSDDDIIIEIDNAIKDRIRREGRQ